jgi:hypothetical protein|tara:strand:- start:41 stop:1114 length:1074 start_codon:yes stop_codon:yes gene_type:complete
MNEGIIYIARNPTYKEDIYKVGKTERTNLSENRMVELSNHEGIIGKFMPEGYLLVNDVNEAEKICHNELKEYRYQNNREFFKLDIKTLTDKIRRVLSKHILRDNFPHFETKDSNLDEPANEREKTFHAKILGHVNSALLGAFSKREMKKFRKDIDEEIKEIGNRIESERAVFDQIIEPWIYAVETKSHMLSFELTADHKDFIGIDLIHGNILENLFKSPGSVENKTALTSPERKVELILENDPKYTEKVKLTKNKLKKIYKNDELFLKYNDIKSQEVKNVYKTENYIWYGFFTSAEKISEISRKAPFHKSAGKKTGSMQEARDFNLFQPKTIFWKGSINRVVVELKDVIQNIKLGLD